LSYVYSDGRPNRWDAAEVERRRENVLKVLRAERDGFILRHQDRLLEALEVDGVEIPVDANDACVAGDASRP
jgi:hypothetical protein